MNASFDAFRIVNTYGAFGSVTKIRHEVILQGTSALAGQQPVIWKEFQFTCKPGDINRRPCIISPYHFRIDWLMWFAAFQNYQVLYL
jgi:lipase maturation factor 1